MNTLSELLRAADQQIERIERGGGPIRAHRASYLSACGAVDSARRQRDLGALPLLAILQWAVAALVGVATVVGGVAIARSTSEAATVTRSALDNLLGIATAVAGVWAAAKLAPTVASGYVATSRTLRGRGRA